MIERYSRKEMAQIWSDESKFNAFLKVEILACKAWSKLGVIPKQDIDKIEKKASFNLERIAAIEAQTRHDVIAFTRCVSESLDDEKKWIHYGLTSTDVVDTAYGYLYKQANTILRNDLNDLLEALKEKALAYKYTPRIGRTHGVHAEITSFGLLFALYYDELKRQIIRFDSAAEGVEVGKISGAVGTFENTSPFIQDDVCKSLGIQSVNMSTQILQRDRHATYYTTLAIIGGTLEKIATEIRHLQRTEVREVFEYFEKNQKGSSAMPHKKNPIASENICGCARILRGYALSSMENMNLWHERDISHSSAERILSMDATSLLDYMLVRMTKMIQRLIVYPEQMLKNIYLTNGVIFSQKFVTRLIEKGYSREKAYDIIQPLAIQAFEQGESFKNLMQQTNLFEESEIETCMDVHHAFKYVDDIYKRVGIID